MLYKNESANFISVICSPQFYSVFSEIVITKLNDNLSLSLWKTDKSALVVADVSQTDASFDFGGACFTIPPFAFGRLRRVSRRGLFL